MMRNSLQRSLVIPVMLMLLALPAMAQPLPDLPPLPEPGGATPPALPGEPTPGSAPLPPPAPSAAIGAPPAPLPPAAPAALPPGNLPPLVQPAAPSATIGAPPAPLPPAAPAALPPGNLPPLVQPGAPEASTSGTAPAADMPPLGSPLPIPPATVSGTPQSPATQAEGELPVLPNGAAPTPVTPVPTQPARVFSYGKSGVSILFLPEQITKMKEAIEVWEGTDRAVPAAPTFVGAEPEIIKQVIEEPETYPVFYLSSIVYHNSADWAVWVSGFKIAATKNETDVNVISVAKDTVTLSWKPKYGEAVTRRVNEKLFAPTEPVKNKLAKTQNVRFDETNGTVIFSLNQNQSFAVGYFNTFEGYMESPKLDPLLTNTVAIGSNVTPPSPVSAQPTAKPAAATKNSPIVPSGGPPLPSTPTFSMQPRQ